LGNFLPVQTVIIPPLGRAENFLVSFNSSKQK